MGLQYDLLGLLEDVPLKIRYLIIDTSSKKKESFPYLLRQVTQYLHDTFPGQWIGCPPAFPNLGFILLHFCLWGWLKRQVLTESKSEQSRSNN